MLNALCHTGNSKLDPASWTGFHFIIPIALLSKPQPKSLDSLRPHSNAVCAPAAAGVASDIARLLQ